ncbi:MAG: hypothetical protein GEU86_09780 [Actinophytocola sp.]|nr:hypothetical protein [Actinophytocola sp.]
MPARRRLLAVLVTVLVAAVAASVFFGVRAHELRSTPSAANAALADPEATEEVIERVSAGLKAVFSYDYTNLARTERAVGLALTGSAASEYRTEFEAAAKRAKREKLVRTSSVRSIGVRELSAERAELLVFLDQQTLRTKGAPASSTATLDVTAHRVDGTWRIAAITSL